jgi:hypothetical protein
MKRIMYIEYKGESLAGAGRIGWVELSKAKRSYRYNGKVLQKCVGYKYNCFDVETGEHYWVSGPKRDGSDRLYGGIVEIDDDAKEEYWTSIRKMPECTAMVSYKVR